MSDTIFGDPVLPIPSISFFSVPKGTPITVRVWGPAGVEVTLTSNQAGISPVQKSIPSNGEDGGNYAYTDMIIPTDPHADCATLTASGTGLGSLTLNVVLT